MDLQNEIAGQVEATRKETRYQSLVPNMESPLIHYLDVILLVTLTRQLT